MYQSEALEPEISGDRAIELCREDKQANWRLFEAEYDRVIAAAALALAGAEAADDVAQEARLRIYRGFETYDGARGGIRAWLRVVVRNAAADYFSGLQDTLPEDSLAGVGSNRPGDNPEAAALAKLELAETAGRIGALKKADRFILAGLAAGLSREAIAEKIGRSRSYVDVRVHRLRRRLFIFPKD